MKAKLFAGILILLVSMFGAGLLISVDRDLSQYPTDAEYRTIAHEIGRLDFRCFDKDGNLVWEELDRENDLADEGEYLFLDVVLRGGTVAPEYFLRLYNDTPTETDTLSTLTGEPSTYGYHQQLVEKNNTGWPTLGLDSGDYQATSSTETFTASGGSWGPVIYCVLATTSGNGGKLVSYTALSQSRTLASGESLQVTYKLKLQ